MHPNCAYMVHTAFPHVGNQQLPTEGTDGVAEHQAVTCCMCSNAMLLAPLEEHMCVRSSALQASGALRALLPAD